MTSGAARYPNRGAGRRPIAATERETLGMPLLPAEVYVVLRRVLRLSDAELLAACAAGGAALAHGAQGPLSEVEDLEAAIATAAEVTRSRLTAWRKHAKQMTWDELRVLLLGLQAQSESGAYEDT